MDHKEIQNYREGQIKTLPRDIGVYALCDALGTERYIGQTVDSIRSRVQRHTTSARSDVIANRLIDAGEVAFVRCYPCETKEQVKHLEHYLIHHFNDRSPLMNSKIPKKRLERLDFEIPESTTFQIIPEEVLKTKKQPANLVMRQMKLHGELLDYILNVKDNSDLRRSLKASVEILNSYHRTFLGNGA